MRLKRIWHKFYFTIAISPAKREEKEGHRQKAEKSNAGKGFQTHTKPQTESQALNILQAYILRRKIPEATTLPYLIYLVLSLFSNAWSRTFILQSELTVKRLSGVSLTGAE